ncbi:branched-chain amino acid ABC transporter permease [Microbacterium gorillae]|uniref:branched-chain amino acid ABC transporter permease n=1 Tax=Microbacterium gorillae TaxID=1231063 RepID=UPI00058E6E51|nr:branched-chain amino acid ABC transporter permease [Microbacterium gorillae]
MDVVYAIIQGILLGGLYALFAAGLSFMFGVMRLVNLAHGALAVLAAYGALLLVRQGVPSPLLALVVVVPAMALLGYVLQRTVLQRTLSDSPLPSLLVTFGLAVIIENVLLVTQSANQQRLSVGALDTASIPLFGGLSIGVFPLLVLVFAVLALGGLSLLLRRSAFGRQVRAVSDDPGTVSLVGANPKHVYAVAAAIAFGLVAVAGVAGGVQSGFNPTSGGMLLIFAFEAVIIGGLGSLWGTLLGSVILGVVQTLAARVDSTLFQLAGHIVFLVFLILLPQGLIRRKVRQ